MCKTQILWKFHQELLSYCPWFDFKMLVQTTPPTVSVWFALYLAEVFIRSEDVQDANFVKILSRVNELLPLIRLKKSCFNLFLLTRSFFHLNKKQTIPIFVNISLLYPGKMKVFRGKLESACLSIHVSICPCVSPSVHKILVSVKALAGVLSHI